MNYPIISYGDVPCIAEDGGASKHVGLATIVTNDKGEKLNACKKYKHVYAGQALIPVQVGNIVIKVYRGKQDYDIDIYRISKIVEDTMTAELEEIYCFKNERWYPEQPNENIMKVVEIAKQKSMIPKCNTAQYIQRKLVDVNLKGTKMFRYRVIDNKRVIQRDTKDGLIVVVTNDGCIKKCIWRKYYKVEESDYLIQVNKKDNVIIIYKVIGFKYNNIDCKVVNKIINGNWLYFRFSPEWDRLIKIILKQV